MKLTNAFHDSNASVRNLEVKCLELEQSVPVGEVGVIAADPAELPNAVDEIVKHYEHYRDTAEFHSRDWRTRHEPGQTIDHLVSGVAPLSRAA